MAFWDEIGRALRGIWDAFSQDQESPPEPVETDESDQYEEIPEYEQSEIEPGYSFGQPPETDEGGFVYEPGLGPYPDEWDPLDIEYFDKSFDGRIFENDDQYDEAQEAFEHGYMTHGMTEYERDYWREELDAIMEGTFQPDWEAHRDYWEEISPPG